jgi:hypothetical protein
MAKRKKPNPNPEGLGDVVENVLEATGVAKVAKWILGEDCGCDERKATLNKLIPFKRNVQCMNEDEYNWLKKYFDKPESERRVLRHEEKMVTYRIHGRLFQKRIEPSNCVPCVITMLDELKIVFDEYNK